MKKIILLLFIAFQIKAQNLETLLNEKLTELYDSSQVIGITAAVSIEGIKKWESAVGFSDPVENIELDPRMTFGIGSITKTFVSALILRMVEENKLNLSDKISNWITPNEKIDGDITVEELLRHQSGIDDFTSDEWVASIKANPDKYWTPQEVLDSLVHEPEFEHGAAWQYSNTNYILLGMIIESIEQKKFFEVLRELLTEQDLINTFLPPFESTYGYLAVPWFDINDDGDDENMLFYSMFAPNTSAWTAGALYSTADDLIRWIYKLFNFEIFGEEMFNKFIETVETGVSFDYGLGIVKYASNGKTIYGHGGLFIGYISSLWYEPENQIAVTVLINQTEGNPIPFSDQLLGVVLDYLTTSVENSDLPKDFSLKQNYPNPFSKSSSNNGTTIEFLIPTSSNVTLEVYNILGQKVKTLLSENLNAGVHSVIFNSNNLPSGIYIYRLKAGAFVQAKKMTIIR